MNRPAPIAGMTTQCAPLPDGTPSERPKWPLPPNRDTFRAALKNPRKK
ncbi:MULTISPECIES: hypothetical protein [unclassified Burkholderia]|nr:MULTISPECIES: hypothetical protein [unclassified Burkholderia]